MMDGLAFPVLYTVLIKFYLQHNTVITGGWWLLTLDNQVDLINFNLKYVDCIINQ